MKAIKSTYFNTYGVLEQIIRAAFDQGYFINAFQVLQKITCCSILFAKYLLKSFKSERKQKRGKKTQIKQKKIEMIHYCIKHSGH